MGIMIRDKASHCGVGAGTVSRAMNNSGYVKEETKNAIFWICRRTKMTGIKSF